MYDLTTPAVLSGLSVRLRPFLSWKVYISLVTMSLVTPMPRVNTSVNSKIGVEMRRKPACLQRWRTTFLMKVWNSWSIGRMSCTPFGVW